LRKNTGTDRVTFTGTRMNAMALGAATGSSKKIDTDDLARFAASEARGRTKCRRDRWNGPKRSRAAKSLTSRAYDSHLPSKSEGDAHPRISHLPSAFCSFHKICTAVEEV
jgi:hypothetical protein